jgi:RNA polymerase sigma-70 factor (ECF subfamily)
MDYAAMSNHRPDSGKRSFLSLEDRAALENFLAEVSSAEVQPEAVYETLRSKLESWMSRHLKKRGVRRSDVEDACQEVLLRLMKNVTNLRDPAAFTAYVFRIVQHVARQFRRAYRLRPLAHDIHRFSGPGLALQMDVADSLRQLPVAWAEALILVHVEGYTYQEASEVLGMSFRATKKALEKGRRRLRLLMIAPLAQRRTQVNTFRRSVSTRAGRRSWRRTNVIRLAMKKNEPATK